MNKLSQIFKVKDLRNKILSILGILVVFRLMASIPVPGINVEKVKDFFSGDQFFSMLNVFSGSGMSNFSIVMLGVGPYITASIIMQLMTMVFPQVEKWYREEGEAGRQKFNQITRVLTVPISILQGFAMISYLKTAQVIDNLNWFETGLIVITVCAGTIFLMWLGEIITEKGVGNGVSLLIFAGIVAGLPNFIKQQIISWDESKLITYLAFIAAVIGIIYLIIYVTEGQRNIPVSYAKRMRGSKMMGGSNTYLPLRVNMAGVIPIIFAMSVMFFPQAVSLLLSKMGNETLQKIGIELEAFFNNTLYYGIFYFMLVIGFTFFYTRITFQPKNIAENLQKNGGYIPGVRPGKTTEHYLTRIVNRITLFGAIFLGLIAVLPYVMQFATDNRSMAIGGTSLLIVISVVIETIKQIEGQLVMRSYERIE
ncbi:MAG: preprotein translocase subunit SecY [Candidatus Moranbacteria bacterium]|nr:preprotein translocase subunit SecY [Candidatus Moranbacteria bacterium]